MATPVRGEDREQSISQYANNNFYLLYVTYIIYEIYLAFDIYYWLA